MKFQNFKYCLLICVLMVLRISVADEYIDLTDTGHIPVWLVVGPFDQSLTGFGQAVDENLINESDIIPFEGKNERSSLSKHGEVTWRVQSIHNNGYLDFNTNIGHTKPGRSPEKHWYATDAFASSLIYSKREKDVQLLVGSNSRMKIWLNGDAVYKSMQERGAQADQESISVKLQKGENHILVRVGNSQNNLIIDWFGGTPWGWGFFLRIVNSDQTVPSEIHVVSPVKADRYNCDLESTFFFKKDERQLFQRIDVTIYSSSAVDLDAQLTLDIYGDKFDFEFNNIRCGENRREIYIPALKEDRKAKYTLTIGDQKIKKTRVLEKRNHYELYVVMTSHMDIGYTNTQPVVKERHIQTMLDVLNKCRQDPDFHWMVETPWILEVFESAVSQKTFDEFMQYVKNAQIGISPIYTNPYTGWISTEDMIRSFDKAADYHNRYDVDFPAAMYNDLPGVSWIMPQMLKKVGTRFLACGINEIYSDYRFQRKLPKVFYWEGADDSQVMTYLTNAYTEGRYIGLEKSSEAVEQLLWVKLNRLIVSNYPYEMVLINAAFSDNSGIPTDQYDMMKKWNSLYEYPKLRSATLGEFAVVFERRYSADIPVLKGDWTSDWDILYQSEPKEFIRLRSIQHRMLSAEKLSTINWLLNPELLFPEEKFAEAYQILLNFSGHGSGLEAGFGSPEDNISTMAFRKGNIDQAELQVEELIQRALYRFSVPHASFESEGAIVFNTLTWERDAVVELSFPEGRNLSVDIIDLTTDEMVPYYTEGHKLWFIARNLPSLGYKKYQIIPKLEISQYADNDLIPTVNSIENRFYRINYDTNTIIQIIDKRTQQNLIGKTDFYSFAQPLVKCGTQHEGFKAINQGNPQLTLIDERPVRLVLRIQYENILFESTDFILWSDMDRIDLCQTIDLSKLSKTSMVEEYGLAFPFEIKKALGNIEIIGGYLEPETDRLPGIDHNAFSIRRTIALSNKSSSLLWASMDRRIVRLEYDNSRPVLISNVINNFPEEWNRHQDNTGKLKLNYSFTYNQGTFNPGLTTQFGWETLTPAMVQKGWFSTDKPSSYYLEIDNNNVILLNLRNKVKQNTWQMELLNCNPMQSENISIRSEFFKNREIILTDLLNNTKKMISIQNNKICLTIPKNAIYLLTIK